MGKSLRLGMGRGVSAREVWGNVGWGLGGGRYTC